MECKVVHLSHIIAPFPQPLNAKSALCQQGHRAIVPKQSGLLLYYSLALIIITKAICIISHDEALRASIRH